MYEALIGLIFTARQVYAASTLLLSLYAIMLFIRGDRTFLVHSVICVTCTVLVTILLCLPWAVCLCTFECACDVSCYAEHIARDVYITSYCGL